MSDNKHKEEDIEFMSDTSAAELQSGNYKAYAILWVTFIVFVVAGLWASFATIDEITRGEGVVIPSMAVQNIQNLEGGILQELLVREGEVVKRGQPLMVIDNTQFFASLRETQVKIASIQGKVSRLMAETTGTNLTFPPEFQASSPFVVRDETDLFLSRKREQEIRVQVARDDVTKAEQEIKENAARLEQSKASSELIRQEIAMTEPLVKRGVVAQVDLLRLQRQLNDLSTQVNDSQLAIPRLEAGLAQAKRRVEEIQATFISQAQAELNAAQAELSSLLETQRAQEDRVKRTTINSPVDGIVKTIAVSTIGGIIQPGQVVMEVVPSDDTLLIEAEIKPSDIGFLRPGLKAVVKITAYDFSIFGGMPGIVERISPDTILNEKKENMYQIRVKTDRNYLISPKTGQELQIIPGMRASVDIITGEKTVLQYLLKPVLKAKQTALTER